MIAYWWVILVAINSVLVAFLTAKANIVGGSWIFILLLSGLNPVWVLITRLSKDIVLDSLIYDAVFSVGYIIALLYFSNSLHKVTTVQCIAILMVTMGVLLFKR